jgi:hypothetical protein
MYILPPSIYVYDFFGKHLIKSCTSYDMHDHLVQKVSITITKNQKQTRSFSAT